MGSTSATATRTAARGLITGVRAHFPAGAGRVSAGDGRPDLLSLTPPAPLVEHDRRPRSCGVGSFTVAAAPSPHRRRVLDGPARASGETDLAFLYRLARDYDCKLYLEHGAAPISSASWRRPACSTPAGRGGPDLPGQPGGFDVAFEAFATAAEHHLVTTDPATGETVAFEADTALPGEWTWTPDAERIARMGSAAAFVNALVARSAARRAQLRDYWRTPARAAGVPARPASDTAATYGDRSRRLGQRARGRARGSIWLRPRALVTVAGAGGRWSGEWYLAEVRHVLDLPRRSYTSAFVCTR